MTKNKPTIKQLEISEEQKNEINKIWASGFSRTRKREFTRNIIGYGTCSTCQGVLDLLIQENVGDKVQSIIRNTPYCASCYEKSVELKRSLLRIVKL